MLENIASEIAEELNNAGINAVAAFNASELDDAAAFVCVGLKSARISSSGLGNYIGVCTEDGQLKEMYGEKAELVLSFDIYSPANADEGCSELADGVRCALYSIDGLSVTEFGFEKVEYDGDCRMLRSRCSAKAAAYLVREKLGSSLSGYSIGEGTI